ncbi:MAG: hypothetical protein PQ975_11040, partial [Methanobacterium sp.]
SKGITEIHQRQDNPRLPKPSKIFDFRAFKIYDFERLTQYTRNPNVPKTISCNENYYPQTLPDELKRKYKTPNGITNYLQKQMQNWTGKHIKNANSQ